MKTTQQQPNHHQYAHPEVPIEWGSACHDMAIALANNPWYVKQQEREHITYVGLPV